LIGAANFFVLDSHNPKPDTAQQEERDHDGDGFN
jgi:hypothetical protein